jgi:hypothetical protein
MQFTLVRKYFVCTPISRSFEVVPRASADGLGANNAARRRWRTFATITTDANELVADIHDRMR